MSDPIQSEYIDQMNRLAALIDQFFNGEAKGHDRKVAFVLLVADFGDAKRCNYISNADRSDCVAMMREVTARFQGQPQSKGGRA
jgi:hypothetical protein